MRICTKGAYEKVEMLSQLTIICPDCYKEVTPQLRWKRYSGGQHLGAYCPDCRIWIRWVPQQSPWLEHAPAIKEKIPSAIRDKSTKLNLFTVEEAAKTEEKIIEKLDLMPPRTPNLIRKLLWYLFS